MEISTDDLFSRIGRLAVENDLLRARLADAEGRAASHEAEAANLRTALLARTEGPQLGLERNEAN